MSSTMLNMDVTMQDGEQRTTQGERSNGVTGASSRTPKDSHIRLEDFHEPPPDDETKPSHTLPMWEPSDSTRTGVCYDNRMRRHATLDKDDIHPEDPRRIAAIYELFGKAGLLDGRIRTRSRLLFPIPARHATKAEVSLNHTEDLYDFVKSTFRMKDDELLDLSMHSDSVYFSHSSFVCARLSCGGAIDTTLAVMEGRLKNAFAIIRPPGHHAERTHAQGFCFFNNACIAAQVAQKTHPETCKRVLILDWDVHHGNGTQNTFYTDPSVLYVSIHVHNNGHFYPQGGAGGYDRCGLGKGLGKNVNIPWPCHGMGDGDYIHAFQHVVMPIAMEFDPDLVIISAGFDAAEGDEIGQCNVTPDCYAQMTHMLMSLAQGKVVALLEGGYNLNSIAYSSLAVTRTLMGEPPGRLTENMIPSKAGFETTNKVIRQQARYWNSLGVKRSQLRNNNRAERLHDVIRTYQAGKLYKEFKMTTLDIYHNSPSPSYENQVLATSKYWEAKTLLMIVHDPPAVVGSPDPIAGTLQLHDSYLHDAVKSYIQWAVRRGYAVIDVNIPQFVTEVEENLSSRSRSRSPADISQAEEERKLQVIKSSEDLCAYLWDNYLEVSDASNIILMGVGQASYATLHVLSNRECTNRVKGVVHFVGDSGVRAIRSSTYEYINDWYFRRSYNVIAYDHKVWEERKPKKKFGRLIRSDATLPYEMARYHKGEVTRWITEQLGETGSNDLDDDADNS